MEQPEDDGLEGERKRKRIWVEWHEVVLVVWLRPEPFRSQVVYVTERVIRACIVLYTKRQDLRALHVWWRISSLCSFQLA
jgi:hypothetical protein